MSRLLHSTGYTEEFFGVFIENQVVFFFGQLHFQDVFNGLSSVLGGIVAGE